MKAIDCSFQQYEFTQEEVIQARVLSPLTKAYLQNELAVAMLRKVALVYNHEHQKDWELAHAELDGEINCYVRLLDIPPVKPINSTKEQ